MKVLTIKEWNFIEKYSLLMLTIPFFVLNKEYYIFFVKLFFIYTIAVQVTIFDIFLRVKKRVAERWIKLFTTEINFITKFFINGTILGIASFLAINNNAMLFKVIFVYVLKEIMIYVYYSAALNNKVFQNRINIGKRELAL